MSTVPFSPLTLGELNARVDHVQRDLSWTVWNAYEGGRRPDGHQERRIRELATTMNDFHEAAMLRVGQ